MKHGITHEWATAFLKKAEALKLDDDVPPGGRPTGKVLHEIWFTTSSTNEGTLARTST